MFPEYHLCFSDGDVTVPKNVFFDVVNSISNIYTIYREEIISNHYEGYICYYYCDNEDFLVYIGYIEPLEGRA